MSLAQVTGSAIGEAIREAVPPALLPVVLFITWLGNVVFLLVLFTADYWFGDHRRGAHALSLALAGMALITTLKAVFAEPRPPESVRVIATGGFSFPSGHATIAAIGYGALAHDLEVGTRRQRSLVAGVLIVLVALSRVALGVHFFRDVVAGVIVGLAFLAAAVWLTGHEPRRGFLLAGVIAVAAAVVSGASQDAVAEFGAVLGAVAAWELFAPLPSVETLAERAVLVVVGVPVFAALSYLSLLGDLPLAGVFALNVALLAGVVIAPLPVTRFVD